MSAGKVAILTTGGTVAMRFDPQAGGAVPALSAAELAEILPDHAPQLMVREVCNLPSSHFRLETVWKIKEEVAVQMSDPSIVGVVVTHGTDVLEETAYLLDLTVAGETPMVVTGAMRTASDLGADGPANLWAAVRVANSPLARGLGCLVVLDDEIHAARAVTKMDTLSTATFQSPGLGPLGRVEGDHVRLPFRVRRDVFACDHLEERVSVIKLAVGAEPHLLDSALSNDARGIVLEALGGGRIPPWWLPSIEKALEDNIAVVVASRCPSGSVWDGYGYIGSHHTLREMGCLFANGLNGQKARIRLMVVLGAAAEPAHVPHLWRGPTAGQPPASRERSD
jgi:L-asparaginase